METGIVQAEVLQTIYGVALVPLIIAFVAMAKQAGLNSKYGGVLALALGVGIITGYGCMEAGWTVFKCLITGSAVGLSAAGVYSTQKNVREGTGEGTGEGVSKKEGAE